MPGLRERWGRDVVHCPYCHGYEVRDEPVGVIGTTVMSVHQALMWRQWCEDVVLFVHTSDEPTDEQARAGGRARRRRGPRRGDRPAGGGRRDHRHPPGRR
ncbi:hypothetical protein GCM10025868_05730 [Angustibacter aerolatus]|uniref:Uncharacterized protein n=1 Tax=Angustibacter aerolatus TaxID=1162965 RepID=A0ABQ6JCY2_9ACTN|nr:hypothetical protein [Angustibacter aerolatus]GMA85323.1 hypothetical protein GCM10025868_05730 [Angustibacter aerolatus]